MKVYNSQEAAKRLGISRSSLRQKIESGEIKAISYQMIKRDRIYIPEVLLDFKERKATKPKVIAFSNIKGGVGKTTISTNFAHTISLLGKRVLLIDTDAQANATRYLGAIAGDNEPTLKHIYQLMMTGEAIDASIIKEAIKRIDFPNASLDVIPSQISLGRVAEGIKGTVTNPYKLLKKIVDQIKDDYDVIVIDTPPSPGISLQMAIYASDEIVIVSDAEDFSVEGLNTLIEEIEYAKDELEAKIRIGAIFVNKLENISVHKLYNDRIKEIADLYQVPFVYQVPKLVRVKEVQLAKTPLLEYKDELDDEIRASESILMFAVETVNLLESFACETLGENDEQD